MRQAPQLTDELALATKKLGDVRPRGSSQVRHKGVRDILDLGVGETRDRAVNRETNIHVDFLVDARRERVCCNLHKVNLDVRTRPLAIRMADGHTIRTIVLTVR